MSESVEVRHAIGVDGDQAFRFEYGPGTSAYLEPRDFGDLVVTLADGRVVEQVERSLFESVFDLATVRLTPDGAVPVHDADPLAGYLDAGTSHLVQVRTMPEIPQAWANFPVIVPGDVLHAEARPVVEAAWAAVTGLAPEGWQALEIKCTATVRRMELTATVTFAGGETSSWSPPAMVGQWLHRSRMREFGSNFGTWFTARFRFTPGAPADVQYDFDNEPEWQAPGGRGSLGDELRLLPRRAAITQPWLLGAAVNQRQRLWSANLSARTRAEDQGGTTELVRLFDGVDAEDRPVWYRPMVGRREMALVLDYLRAAPLVLSSRGLTADLLAPQDEPAVPMGFHTDGRFVWPSAVAYYLDKHDVPPVLDLVDHIRTNHYQLPAEVPKIAMRRAAALAMGRPWRESEVDAAFEDAMTSVRSVITRYRTSPRFYSLGAHQDQAWCLVREGDWYVVYRAEGDSSRSRKRFGDVGDAAAYFCGQLVADHEQLRFGQDEEIPWWQAPFGTLSELDPPLQEFTQVMAVLPADLEVDRYGTPDGNLVYAADTPFEQRGLPADHAEREYHRYRLPYTWSVITAVSPAGGRIYLLPQPIAHYLGTGEIQEITDGPSSHPGLPPITDALRAEAKRNPGGWVWCADPEVDPRYIEGAPNFTLLGAYKVDDSGDLTGVTYINDAYLPGPSKRGFPEPLSEFELVLNFVAAGWLPHERILPAVLDSPFQLETDGAGGLRIGVDGQGRQFLAVYSSPRYLPPNANAPMQAQGEGLVGALPGVTLVINPGGEMSIELPGDDVVATYRTRSQPRPE
ncbi:TNT domain-containing protein [Actinokineospora sp.]|uniref:TNT domain-containing protein n=1 Tax=Actinokineospora sp. TaxID=1872133 RepID=UPI003D6A5B92